MPDLTLYVDLPADGLLQTQLRKGYLAAIQRLESNGQEISVVDGGDAQMGLACKRHIARLLKLELPVCE